MVFITDGNGHLVQHIQYVPFGEVFIEQRNSTWNTPYKFNGKELDEETGLAYYHARYYDPRTSVWLSVDPLAEKYPNIGSYVYCANNPVKYVDPDGKRVVNYRRYVLSNKTLISYIKAFDKAVSELTGKKTNTYTMVITGGDRYRKNGKVYSATNHQWIERSAKNSSHLQENGATGVDLSLPDGISYEILVKAASIAGLRIDPAGKYNDGHFHLDLKGVDVEMEYNDKNYIPSDSDFEYFEQLNDNLMNSGNDESNTPATTESTIESIVNNWKAIRSKVAEHKKIIQEIRNNLKEIKQNNNTNN